MVLAGESAIYNSLGENERAAELSEAAFIRVRKSADRFTVGHMLAGLAFNLLCIQALNR